ncbi:3-methyladenine DNA glycosylase AlkD [Amycolatopsis marina]|uniref:3-methyladenine DNA glycosylase AlkD n=1 Tax=Amycolatopsis marina TaxID=490629 RepID=A0A1I1CE42_9PSEU|nr:DNA alkylation repair protein [Amycolatopsis marina]SFB59148.1 3-methyladenine DNA glycosylase AlkD [Amycolatopsis marina]
MELTAQEFVSALRQRRSETERAKIQRRYRGPESEIVGVRMKDVFDSAASCADMSLAEVEKLLDAPFYEARLGAVSILDFKARRKRITEEERRGLYELYLRRHDRIDSWDLVDRAAPRVVGWYLLDKPRDPLYALARSSNVLERRTAITAAFWLIRNGDITDALNIAEILLGDEEELIHKSVGTGLREIGKIDQDRLVDFLREHADTIPRVTVRYASEKLPAEVRAEFVRQPDPR